MSKDQEILKLPEPKNVYIQVPIKNTNFGTWEEAMAILKNDDEMTIQDWISYFEIFLGERKEEYKGVCEFTEDDFFNKMIQPWGEPFNRWIPNWTREEFKKKIENTIPMTAADIFIKYHDNAEQMMRALSFINPEEIIKSTNASLINEETLTKTQERTFVKDQDSLFNMESELNDDMFEVKDVTFDDTYKLYKIPGNELHLEEDAFVVACNCTSTGRKYFLFVEEEFATTAIDAIASTLRDSKGERMTREEYLKIESES